MWKKRAISKYTALPINSGNHELSSTKCRCISGGNGHSSFMADVESSQHKVHRKERHTNMKIKNGGFLFGGFFFFFFTSPEKLCGMLKMDQKTNER